jgi:predicted aminopeptidase
MLNVIKKLLLIVTCLIIGFSIYHHETVAYFWMQAKGGLDVAFNTRKISELIADPSIADSTKKRFAFVDEIKKFGKDSLGLNIPDKNYTTYYEQKGKPLVYVLVVTEPFNLKNISFDFPVIGSFEYKGFFELEKAKIEELKYKKVGYDTQINEASAYSTLGYLPEPILSSMLWRKDGNLANLLLHEMTHSTVFIKNDHELSENLANFIGDLGAEKFLESKYGEKSTQIIAYQERKHFNIKFNQFMFNAANKLNNLYLNFVDTTAKKLKLKLKKELINDIILAEDSLYLGFKQIKFRIFDKKNPPNNSFFAGYLTYHSKKNEIEEMYNSKFKYNFEAFLTYWKNKYN